MADDISQRRPLAEPLVVFVAATLFAAILFQLARIVPLIADNLQAFVAIAFIYLPVAMARRRGQELTELAFTTRPLGRGLAFGLGGPAIVFPVVLVGFVLFYGVVCNHPAWTELLAPRGMCRRFVGWVGLEQLRIGRDFWVMAFSELVVTAIPEELFFSGYLLGRFEEIWPPQRRILGGGIGRALLLSSLLFGVGHVIVDLDPLRLSRFFPGLLFGWMRSATGSILAGTLAHAASNLYIRLLLVTFFA